VTRGLHAHRALNQLAVAVAGRCTMLLDDGASRVEVRLDDPAMALTLPPTVWHEMRRSNENVIIRHVRAPSLRWVGLH